MALNPPGVLPCGRDSDTVYDHLRAGLTDPHEQDCPHCQAVRHQLAPVATAAASLRSRAPAPPAGFVASVMARIRAEPLRSRKLALPAEPPATLRITEQAAAAILSLAAASIPGITSRGCIFAEPDDPGHVTMLISIRYGLPAPDSADQIRDAVRRAARQQLGISLHQIDITVEDVNPGS